jgi:hypothetical protein
MTGLSTIPPGAPPQVLADLNGDGRLDLVTAHELTDDVSVLLGKGDGTFEEEQRFAAGEGPQSLYVLDVDGDGRLDLVTVHHSPFTINLLLGNGDGTFQEARPLSLDEALHFHLVAFDTGATQPRSAPVAVQVFADQLLVFSTSAGGSVTYQRDSSGSPPSVPGAGQPVPASAEVPPRVESGNPRHETPPLSLQGSPAPGNAPAPTPSTPSPPPAAAENDRSAVLLPLQESKLAVVQTLLIGANSPLGPRAGTPSRVDTDPGRLLPAEPLRPAAPLYRREAFSGHDQSRDYLADGVEDGPPGEFSPPAALTEFLFGVEEAVSQDRQRRRGTEAVAAALGPVSQAPAPAGDRAVEPVVPDRLPPPDRPGEAPELGEVLPQPGAAPEEGEHERLLSLPVSVAASLLAALYATGVYHSLWGGRGRAVRRPGLSDPAG